MQRAIRRVRERVRTWLFGCWRKRRSNRPRRNSRLRNDKTPVLLPRSIARHICVCNYVKHALYVTSHYAAGPRDGTLRRYPVMLPARLMFRVTTLRLCIPETKTLFAVMEAALAIGLPLLPSFTFRKSHIISRGEDARECDNLLGEGRCKCLWRNHRRPLSVNKQQSLCNAASISRKCKIYRTRAWTR